MYAGNVEFCTRFLDTQVQSGRSRIMFHVQMTSGITVGYNEPLHRWTKYKLIKKNVRFRKCLYLKEQMHLSCVALETWKEQHKYSGIRTNKEYLFNRMTKVSWKTV